MADRAFLETLSRRLADDGKLIEAGWVGLRLYTGLSDASPLQLDEMRMAFMAGAQHLFSSIMTILDPGVEETQADLRRMSLIAQELEKFRKEIEVRAAHPQGST